MFLTFLNTPVILICDVRVHKCYGTSSVAASSSWYSAIIRQQHCHHHRSCNKPAVTNSIKSDCIEQTQERMDAHQQQQQRILKTNDKSVNYTLTLNAIHFFPDFLRSLSDFFFLPFIHLDRPRKHLLLFIYSVLQLLSDGNIQTHILIEWEWRQLLQLEKKWEHRERGKRYILLFCSCNIFRFFFVDFHFGSRLHRHCFIVYKKPYI